MTAALIVAMFFTVALLVTTANFLRGSVPLLVLKHDTPLHSRAILINVVQLAVIAWSLIAFSPR